MAFADLAAPRVVRPSPGSVALQGPFCQALKRVERTVQVALLPPHHRGRGHTPPLGRTGEAKRNLEDQGWSPPLLSVDLPFLCRLIELHSPDSRNTLILRCKDTATAHSWFMAIHTNIMALLPQVLAELNTMLGASHTAGSSREVKQIAWLAEQVSLCKARFFLAGSQGEGREVIQLGGH